MRYLLLVVPIAAALLLAQVPASPPHRSAMPAFWRFVEAARHAPEKQIPELFRQHVVKAHPELFVPGVLGDPDKDPQAWDARTLRYWNKLQPMLPQIRSLEQEMEATLTESGTLFRRHFPDFQLEVQVVIAPSLFQWDGSVRQVGDGSAMLFGPDGAAFIHEDQARGRLRPLMIHEFFHLSHTYEAEDPPDVLTMLWREGLASYVSHALLPEARLEDVLLSTELANLSREQEARLSREILARLTRNDDAAREPFFSYSREPVAEGIPPRVGYLLGYRVAQRLGKTRSLQELARLQRAELEPLIREALNALAQPPPSGQSAPTGQ